MPEPGVGFSTLDRLEALVANPALFELAEAVPEPDPSAGGRPRQYPVFMWLLFDALLSVYGSGRKVEGELAHPAVWSRLRRHVRDARPRRPDLWLPERPMRRYHYLYGRSRYLTAPGVLERLAEIHRRTATRQAESVGLLDLDGCEVL